MKNELPNKSKSYNFFFNTLVLLALGGAFINLSFFLYKQTPRVVVREINEMEFWRSLSQKYPTYRDAYVAMAMISLKRGDNEAYIKAISKARGVDPFFTP